MKFIRCVIEVRPFRLLVDCIAAYEGLFVSYAMATRRIKGQSVCSRIQQ